MQQLIEKYKQVTLMAQATKTSTFTGSAVEVDANINDDILAIASLGAVATDVTDTCVITITGATTSGGSYSTVATFPGTAKGNGGGAQYAMVAFKRGLNRFFKPVLTIVSGNSASFNVGILLLVQSVNQSSTLNTASLV